ncbi:hypothetical protein D3C71_1505340 [compost metagenome]
MIRLGLLGAVVIPLHIKLLEPLRIVNPLLDHEAAHHPPGLLGVEADDLVLAILEVLEIDIDHPGLQGAALDRAEVLVAGQIEQQIITLVGQRLVQPCADALAPEGVEVLAAGVGQLGAHLQAVGLHQVERAQQAIEAREHAQVVLSVAEVVFTQALGIEAGVHVTLERQQRLLGIGRGEVWGPAGKARGIQAGELVGQVHQFADLRRRQVAQLLDQLLGVVQVLGQGETLGHRRGVVVEGLGGGNHRQHRSGS